MPWYVTPKIGCPFTAGRNPCFTCTLPSSIIVNVDEAIILKEAHNRKMNARITSQQIALFDWFHPEASLKERETFIASIDYSSLQTAANIASLQDRYGAGDRLYDRNLSQVYVTATVQDSHYGEYTGKCITGGQRLYVENTGLLHSYPTHHNKKILRNVVCTGMENYFTYIVAGVIELRPDTMTPHELAFACNPENMEFRENYHIHQAAKLRLLADPKNKVLQAEALKAEVVFDTFLRSVETRHIEQCAYCFESR